MYMHSGVNLMPVPDICCFQFELSSNIFIFKNKFSHFNQTLCKICENTGSHFDSVLMRENTSQWKHIFSHVLCSEIFSNYWLSSKSLSCFFRTSSPSLCEMLGQSMCTNMYFFCPFWRPWRIITCSQLQEHEEVTGRTEITGSWQSGK